MLEGQSLLIHFALSFSLLIQKCCQAGERPVWRTHSLSSCSGLEFEAPGLELEAPGLELEAPWLELEAILTSSLPVFLSLRKCNRGNNKNNGDSKDCIVTYKVIAHNL